MSPETVPDNTNSNPQTFQLKNNHDGLRSIGIIIAISGAASVFTDWAHVPILGTITGINNGAGMFALLAFIIVGILFLVSNDSSGKNGVDIAIFISSSLAAICGVYYADNFSKIIQMATATSKIEVFGAPVGNVFEPSDFSLDYGCYLTIITGGLCAIIAIALLLTNNNSKESAIVSDNTENINPPILKAVPNVESNVIPSEIYEDEQPQTVQSKNNFDNHRLKISELKKMKQLLDSKILTQEEFNEEKIKILSSLFYGK